MGGLRRVRTERVVMTAVASRSKSATGQCPFPSERRSDRCRDGRWEIGGRGRCWCRGDSRGGAWRRRGGGGGLRRLHATGTDDEHDRCAHHQQAEKPTALRRGSPLALASCALGTRLPLAADRVSDPCGSWRRWYAPRLWPLVPCGASAHRCEHPCAQPSVSQGSLRTARRAPRTPSSIVTEAAVTSPGAAPNPADDQHPSSTPVSEDERQGLSLSGAPKADLDTGPLDHPRRLRIWLLLDAPTLQHNAKVSPVGTRRTVSLDVLGPIAAVSRGLGLSHVVSIGDGIIGRSGNQPGNGSAVLTRGPHHGSPTPTTAPKQSPTATQHDGPRLPEPNSSRAVACPRGRRLPRHRPRGLARERLANTGVVTATLDGKESTGLTRPDTTTGPPSCRRISPSTTPVVVIMVGATIPRTFPVLRHPLWHPRVERRLLRAGAELHDAGLLHRGKGRVGRHAPDAIPGLSAAMANLTASTRPMRQRTAVTYLSSLTILGTPQGQFTPFITANGQEVQHREPDGTHISRRRRGAVTGCHGNAGAASCTSTFLPDMARGLASRSARRKSTDHPAGRPSPRVHERWGLEPPMASTRRSTSRT